MSDIADIHRLGDCSRCEYRATVIDAERKAGCSQIPLTAETIPGGRAVYACTEHDDCREHPEIGVACWRERTTRRTTR